MIHKYIYKQPILFSSWMYQDFSKNWSNDVSPRFTMMFNRLRLNKHRRVLVETTSQEPKKKQCLVINPTWFSSEVNSCLVDLILEFSSVGFTSTDHTYIFFRPKIVKSNPTIGKMGGNKLQMYNCLNQGTQTTLRTTTTTTNFHNPQKFLLRWLRQICHEILQWNLHHYVPFPWFIYPCIISPEKWQCNNKILDNIR